MGSNSPSGAIVNQLAAAIRSGSIRALSRGLSWIEADGDRAEALVETLYSDSRSSEARSCHVVGITGAAGAGKSTLVAALAKVARLRGLTVGILAVDPSSPFTGGAILGDRVRMHELFDDPRVFIRSLATRGELGGLCKAAAGGIDLLRAAGYQLVLVETVGVGQDEVDIMRVVHTTVVVSAPGLGDDVQTLKAGLFEIADIHVVNKADREGAGETAAQIQAMLAMGLALGTTHDMVWQPPVIQTVAPRSEGVAGLLDAMAAHMAHLRASGELHSRERRMAESRVLKLAQGMVAGTLRRPEAATGSAFDVDLDRVTRREMSPYACARALLERAAAGR